MVEREELEITDMWQYIINILSSGKTIYHNKHYNTVIYSGPSGRGWLAPLAERAAAPYT
jgi:hypothetical protein